MGSVISHSSSFDHYIHVVVSCQTGIHHLLRSFYIYNFNVRRRCKRAGACNKGYFCSAFCSCLCNGITHFAAAAVAYITHRVNWFTRTGSSYQNFKAAHIAFRFCKKVLHKINYIRRFRQTPCANGTAGQYTACRRHHHNAAAFNLGNIFLRGRVFIHMRIHGRAHNNR